MRVRGVTVEEVSEAEEHHLAGCAGVGMFIEMRGGLLQRIGDGGAEMSPWRNVVCAFSAAQGGGGCSFHFTC